MAEPLFGSASQLWPAMPAPAFGFVQGPPGSRPMGPFGPMPFGGGPMPFAGGPMPFAGGPMPFGGGPMPFGGGMMPGGPNPNPMPGELPALGSGIPTSGGGHYGAGLSAAIVPGPVGSFPPFTGSEIAVGVAAPALLAAVAMRRGQPLGPTNDQEIEDFIYDTLDLLPGATDVEVRSEGGRISITGSVPHKRLKRDVGEIAWAVPSVNDVQNNITITARRRSRQGREEPQSVGAARKS